jgi:hypothetical protein
LRILSNFYFLSSEIQNQKPREETEEGEERKYLYFITTS